MAGLHSVQASVILKSVITFSFDFGVVYGRLYGLIWVSISDSFVFNVGDPLNIEWELR